MDLIIKDNLSNKMNNKWMFNNKIANQLRKDKTMINKRVNKVIYKYKMINNQWNNNNKNHRSNKNKRSKQRIEDNMKGLMADKINNFKITIWYINNKIMKIKMSDKVNKMHKDQVKDKKVLENQFIH